jgi:hypothetical protein
MKNPVDYSTKIPPEFKRIFGLVLECEGRIRFTHRARNLLTGIFGYHGFDICQIRTVDQYQSICDQITDRVVADLPEVSQDEFSGKELIRVLKEVFPEGSDKKRVPVYSAFSKSASSY